MGADDHHCRRRSWSFEAEKEAANGQIPRRRRRRRFQEEEEEEIRKVVHEERIKNSNGLFHLLLNSGSPAKLKTLIKVVVVVVFVLCDQKSFK